MKTTDQKRFLARVVTGILLLLACFYMYDFYKCLSGFIANGFREPQVMLPMILAFFLPVLCFLGFFYEGYVRKTHPVVRRLCAAFVTVYAIVDLVFIFARWELYTSNHALGVYDALPGLFPRFPYGMVLLLLALVIWQAAAFLLEKGKCARMGAFLEGMKQRGSLQLGVVEYVLLSILAVVAFVFAGAAITATFTAFGNVFYDARYLFLLTWVAIIPLGNLALLAWKPKYSALKKRTKLTLLGVGVGANVLFGALFWLFELTCPDFLVYVSKPLFLIAFSVSLPIEPAILFGIMALGTVVTTLRLVFTIKERA